MSEIIDAYTDGPAMTKLAGLDSDKVVQACVQNMDAEKVASLPSAAFAWEEERRFPVHTPEDTVLSFLYLTKAASFDVPETVLDKLATAVKVYGLENTVEELKPTTEKVASAKVAYLLPEHKALPVFDADSVKQAEAKLHKEYYKLTLEARGEVFNNLTKAASDLSVELDARTHRFTGATFTDTQKLAEALEVRATLSPNSELCDAFDKLASAVREEAPLITDKTTQNKIAAAVGTLDSAAGFVFSNDIPDPVLTVFNTTKLAAHGVNVMNQTVPIERLAEFEDTFWADLQVPEIADLIKNRDIEQLQTVMDTLPLDLKQMIVEQL